MKAFDAIVDLHTRLVCQYAANPTEQGRQLIATAEIIMLALAEGRDDTIPPNCPTCEGLGHQNGCDACHNSGIDQRLDRLRRRGNGVDY